MIIFSLLVSVLIGAINLLLPGAVQAATGIIPPTSASDLILYWKFDEGSGSIVQDYSGSNNNGTIYGATYAEGKFGKALNFDGTDDLVDGGDNASLNLPGDFTIEFWANLRSSSRFKTVLTKGYVAPFPYRFEFFANQKIDLVIQDGKKGPAAVAQTNIIGGWHHIAGVRDTSAKKLSLYIDGNLEKVVPDTTTSSTGNQGRLYLGGRLKGSGQTYLIDGLIDELKIYQTVRTTDQIKEDAGLVDFGLWFKPTPSPSGLTFTVTPPTPTPTSAPISTPPLPPSGDTLICWGSGGPGCPTGRISVPPLPAPTITPILLLP